MPRSVQYVCRCQNLLKLNMQCRRTIPKENTKNKPPSLTFSKIPRTWSFHVVVLRRTAKKCTKNYNARVQLLFCSLNLLFCGVLVAVAVVVCLRSLFSSGRRGGLMVSALVSGSSGLGSSLGWGHCLGQDTLFSPFLSLTRCRNGCWRT